MLCISLDLAAPRRCKVEWAPICAQTPHDKSASFALARVTMSVRLPSRRLIRYISGHFGSGTMRGSNVGSLRDCLSVTRCVFCSSDVPMAAVTLTTASWPTLGRVAGTRTSVPRSRARCAAFRQRGLQSRAVDRRRANGSLQVEQMAAANALTARLRRFEARACEGDVRGGFENVRRTDYADIQRARSPQQSHKP
jgi:hypothetical protein